MTVRLSKKTAVATPAVAQAAAVYGPSTTFTTASSGSKTSDAHTRSGSLYARGDISNSSTLASYAVQIRRDIDFVPDAIQRSVSTTYNATTACTSSFTASSGEGCYNRGAWTVAENPSHSGWFQARTP
jgi:hypothetical protein